MDTEKDVLGIDLHIHAGNERWSRPLSDFASAAKGRGVRIAGFLDHAELFLPGDNPWIDGLYQKLEAGGHRFHPRSIEGLKAVYRDIDQLGRPEGLKIFKGLEFNNVLATPDEFLLLPDYCCFCFGCVEPDSGLNFGAAAAALIRKVGEKIARSGKPGIINHPFRSRALGYKEWLLAGNEPFPEEFLGGSDVLQMVEAAGQYDLAIEVNLNDLAAYGSAEMRPVLDLLIRGYSAMAEAGADLSIGSDSHRPPEDDFSAAARGAVAQAGIEMRHLRMILEKLGC